MNKQTKETDLKLNPELKGTLKALCDDPKTTVVVLSRSGRDILDKVLLMSLFFTSDYYHTFMSIFLLIWYLKIQSFGEYKIWLAAENGMFVRHTTGEWVTNVPENMNLDWVDGTKVSNLLSL